MTDLTVTVSSTEVVMRQGIGTLTVSVTNTGAVRDRVVLGVYPPLDTPSGDSLSPVLSPRGIPAPEVLSAVAWTNIERPLREVAPGVTEQFVITLRADNAEPGDYAVRFMAYSATKAPEEYTDQARTVSIRPDGTPSPSPSPTGPGRPWWLVAATIALVVVVGAVAFTLLRPRSEPTAAPTPTGPNITSSSPCQVGFVPRRARPSDLVCVGAASAAQVIYDNNPDVQSQRHPDPPGGPYGPDTCLQGFVWRDAFAGDHVCVDGATRSRSAQENAAAASHSAP